MRQSVIVCSLALLCISCNRDEPALTRALFVGISPAAVTKSATDDDSKVSSLDLFVFRCADGRLEAMAHGNGLSPLEVTVTRNRAVRWYMIANAPAGRLHECVSEGEFLESVILLEDGFVMHCSGETVIKGVSTRIIASLTRYICKVGIGSISVQLPDGAPYTVKEIVLMSAGGSTPVSGIPSGTDIRYNCGAYDTDLDGLIAVSPGIESASPVNVGVTLWCMPNPSEGNSYGLPWQPRRTRIALCINAWGQDNWYPIDLPPMEENRYYLVDSIIIKGPGAPAPDVKPERIQTAFTVRVMDWEEDNAPAHF